MGSPVSCLVADAAVSKGQQVANLSFVSYSRCITKIVRPLVCRCTVPMRGWLGRWAGAGAGTMGIADCAAAVICKIGVGRWAVGAPCAERPDVHVSLGRARACAVRGRRDHKTRIIRIRESRDGPTASYNKFSISEPLCRPCAPGSGPQIQGRNPSPSPPFFLFSLHRRLVSSLPRSCSKKSKWGTDKREGRWRRRWR